MSESEQIVILYPKKELCFAELMDGVLMTYMKITNPSDRQICYKVKTTDSQLYSVWPNNGLLEPLNSTYVAVLLESIDLSDLSKSTKHWFVVHTMFAPEGDIDWKSVWKEANPKLITKSTLKCVFDTTTHSDEITGRLSSAEPPLLSTPFAAKKGYNIEDQNNEWNVIKELLAENKKLKKEIVKRQSTEEHQLNTSAGSAGGSRVHQQKPIHSKIWSYFSDLRLNLDEELTSGQFVFPLIWVIIGAIIGKVFI